ncbi:MAG: ester cyclase [Rubrobacteraceae bacterium]|nr:ester cyclase [Rubrobacteraceae bacterium]
MTTDYGEGVVRRFWEDIFSQGDIHAMDEVFAADFKLHDLVYRQVHRLMGTKRIVRDTHYDVPGTRVVVEDQRLEADGRVFTRFTVSVSPPEDAETSGQSTPPGGEWEYSGMSISRVVEGKIEETWLVWEALRAAEELSAIFGSEDWRWPPWR